MKESTAAAEVELDQSDEEMLDDLGFERDEEEEETPVGQTEDATEADEESPPQEADDESPADAEPDEEEPTQPEDDGPASEEDAPDEAPAPQGSDNPDDLEPFVPRADGVELQLDGAFRTQGMVVMPEETWARQVQPNLANRRQWVEKERGYKRQIAELDPEKNPDVARARTLVAKIDEFLEDPQAFIQFIQDFERQAPLLRSQAEIAAAKAEAERYKNVFNEREQEQKTAELEPKIREGIGYWVNRMATEADEFKGIPIDWEGVWRTAYEMRDVAAQIAKEDDPETGVTAGQPLINVKLIYELARREAEAIRRATSNSAGAAKAAKKNRAAVGNGRSAPPTVGAKGSATPKKQPKEPTNREEWEEMLRDI